MCTISWDMAKYTYSSNGVTNLHKNGSGTFCQLFNIANRFLWYFFNLETSIKNWFPGSARYPPLPTRLILLHWFIILTSDEPHSFEHWPCCACGWTYNSCSRNRNDPPILSSEWVLVVFWPQQTHFSCFNVWSTSENLVQHRCNRLHHIYI